MKETRDDTAGPLAGIRVLELGNFIAGPFAGQLLGDYGADVIKIESPRGGDTMRSWGVTTDDGHSLWWPAIGRNKRSVAADLRDPDDRVFVQALADTCDVVLENFRPGRLAEFGLDYDTLRRTNPGVIVVHVSGFGQTGPRADEAGFGSIGEAVGGIRHTTGDPDRPSARAGISLGDSLAAMHAVIGTLAALHERSTSGLGQEVDVAIYEAVASIMESTMADYEVAGVIRQRSGGVLPGVAPANAYPCSDGDVLIAGNGDAVFRRLSSVMAPALDGVELADDPRFCDHGSRGANAQVLDQLVGQWTATFRSEDLLTELKKAGVPAGRIYTAKDMVDDEHYLARDMVVRRATGLGVEVPMAGIVPKFSRTPGSVRHVGPELGQHSAELRREVADTAERLSGNPAPPDEANG